uniref:SURP motif domain-containing protein n=2 Tax=Photinus pyralis TaxID=7054 RepID=A0A1Y1KDW5_PHOPY
MAKWTESGILRKANKEKHEDLLVFGYACKLFRDDVKALYIDQGKHLIPWMGEDSLKIDRYDCRGALSELKQYEAGSGGVSRLSEMSESERRMEQMCDEERYYSLKYNEEELEMYKEEELKRLQQKNNEVQYNYDVPTDPKNSQEVSEVVEEEDKPFIPPPDLNVPADVDAPETVKVNARIEKTALFISKQGPQMEILIKTKQADNPQFRFLNKDDRLHKYYKFLLSAIKSGQYKIQQEEEPDANVKREEGGDEDETGDHYLHPSLLAASVQPAPPPLPTVPYKPSADCKYSQLVNRIQGTQTDSLTPPPQHPPPDLSQGQMTYDQQQYYQQYYYIAQYYEYYKQMAQQFQGHNTEVSSDAKIPLETQNQVFPPNQAVYSHYQQQSSNPYAQIVSNLSQSKPPEAEPPAATPTDIAKAPIIYSQVEPAPTEVQPQIVAAAPAPPAVKKPLLSLAQYGSDSEPENPPEPEDNAKNVKIPPTETEQIINKMASYVTKNGKDFENIVRSKGDPRFEFLNESHQFHPYYRLKVKHYSEAQSNKGASESENGVPKSKEKKNITPVSFSIKKPKDEMPKDIKSALPMEESDEEEVVDCKTPVETSAHNTPTTTPVRVHHSASLTPPPRVTEPSIDETKDDSKSFEAEDLILEMIDLTDDLEERRETKRVEDRKKDKIASAAREKLALQLERKKKAAAFLKLKSVKSSPPRQDPAARHKAKRSRNVEVEVLKIEDSESEEGEIKRHKKSAKRKKSHKRKRSRSRHESRSRQKSKEHKKAKKRRRRSRSESKSSSSSQ